MSETLGVRSSDAAYVVHVQKNRLDEKFGNVTKKTVRRIIIPIESKKRKKSTGGVS
ncbi:hypothetical protein GCM10020331_055090 [Ectobacillus funiculus]